MEDPALGLLVPCRPQGKRLYLFFWGYRLFEFANLTTEVLNEPCQIARAPEAKRSWLDKNNTPHEEGTPGPTCETQLGRDVPSQGAWSSRFASACCCLVATGGCCLVAVPRGSDVVGFGYDLFTASKHELHSSLWIL